jgi:hypothetical protein
VNQEAGNKQTGLTCNNGLATLLAANALTSFASSPSLKVRKNWLEASRNDPSIEALEVWVSLPLSLEKTDFMWPCFAFHDILFLDRTDFRAESSGSTVGHSKRSRERNTCDANGSMISELRLEVTSCGEKSNLESTDEANHLLRRCLAQVG